MYILPNPAVMASKSLGFLFLGLPFCLGTVPPAGTPPGPICGLVPPKNVPAPARRSLDGIIGGIPPIPPRIGESGPGCGDGSLG